MHVTVTTQIPSPYQVELFDAVAATGRIELRVIYFQKRHPSRQWSDPNPQHEHLFVDDGDVSERIGGWVDSADLCVFSYYGDRLARNLIRRRGRSGRAWCLWGERPGGRWGRIGQLRRRFVLAELARSRAPIWGIGQWAIDGWRAEFGDDRHYENVPYYSDLSRFQYERPTERTHERRILFSGSLIARKGVDLLAEAFVKIARDVPSLTLTFIGGGEMQDELERMLMPVAAQVRFLGFRQWSELPDHYRRADVLCAPSRYDGWGLIVPEGLAAGLPVIGTRQTGAALELIRPGENGWLVAANDVAELEAALRDAATMPVERLTSMSHLATTAAESHSLKAGAHRYCDAIEAAFAGNVRRKPTADSRTFCDASITKI